MNYFVEFLNSVKRGQVSPVYLFYGEETYLKEQAVLRLKEHLAGGDRSGLNFDLVDGETVAPAEIAARAETLPFLAGKRLVVVKNPAFLQPAGKTGDGPAGDEKGAKSSGKESPLLKYLENPPSSTCLVFVAGESVDRRRRLFQAIKKCGQAVEFTFLSRGELTRWLVQKAGAEGRRFAAGAADALLDAAGPSLQTLVLELEKLFSYTAGQKFITVEDVRAVCPPGPEENIFAVVDAVGNRRCGEALAGIKDMLAAREPPLRILAMITRQFRLLLQVRELLEQGCPPGRIPDRLGVHPYTARKAALQCKNFGRSFLIGALQSLLEIDVAVKGGRQDFYPAVETFLLKLCAGSKGDDNGG
ncbi:DNA polymerase III, delta subunit [Pelotomaculum thermopropionicum SI]|uniref:DNA polymerase III subunit delta n=1 Tax=Pelotomaculum thermopropionicum (strain DSM 13744 / JCM 10971 / SI) TaxID=370438 RepID=A5D3X0_PELTS|nr:DNA polymerase III, delta subunit [Pelotomaculum thermopropionicum SI]